MIEAEGYETTGKYVVGCNMPGYMPDNEPSHFSNYRDALAAFADDTERAIGEHIECRMNSPMDDETADSIDADDDALCTERKRILKYKSKRVQRSMQIGQYRYWLEFAA